MQFIISTCLAGRLSLICSVVNRDAQRSREVGIDDLYSVVQFIDDRAAINGLAQTLARLLVTSRN